MKTLYSDVLMRKTLAESSMETFAEAALDWMLNSGERDEMIEKAYRDFSDLEQLAIQNALAETQVGKRLEILDWLKKMDDAEGEDAIAALAPDQREQVLEAVEYFEKSADENADEDEGERVPIEKYSAFVRTE